MRDLFHSQSLRLAAMAASGLVLAGAPAASAAQHDAARAQATRASSGKKHHVTLAERRARDRLVRKQSAQAKAKAKLTLDLKQRLKRADAAGQLLPFTLRLRKPYEAGPGDDSIELAFDSSAVPWPLVGTVPPSTASTTDVDGSISYYWDFGADTSGYAQLGTVETLVGGNTSMTGSGFPIAQPDGPCSTVAGLEATGITLTSAGLRFGTVNPFSNEVSGTIALRTAVRSKITSCSGGTTQAVMQTSTADPPLPVAFRGKFSVSPSISADGSIRYGVLKVTDTVDLPQRSTFGLIHACTDAAATDCAPQAFPVRTKVLSLTADVLLGDKVPPAPPLP